MPLFFYPWWLDAVSGPDSWEVALAVNTNHEIEGVLPYLKARRFGLSWSGMPMLTPYLGPFLAYPSGLKPAKKVAFEKRVMKALIDQIPRFFYFRQNWYPDQQNWLPFYWQGFRQTTFYTYRFPDIQVPDRLFQRFRSSTRNHIRVARQAYSIEAEGALATFFELNRGTFKARQMAMPYELDFLERIDAPLREKNWRKLYLAYSEERKAIEAGIYIVRDHDTAYLLASGRKAESDSGAVPLLIWHALNQLSREGVRRFDFEGSVIPGIEQFFRSFGGELTPYFQVSKARYRWVEALLMVVRSRY